MTKEYFEAIGKDSLVRMALILQEENDIYKKIIVELAERTCDSCKYWNEFNRCESGVIPTAVTINGETQEISDSFSCRKWEAKDNHCKKEVKSAIESIADVVGGIAKALRDEDAN